ncbi:MAG TPA: PASTA domain-containing protein [Ignavibacteriales bacterium]|nr:PASTA domain-containing protein [Ignavibacteriales bacterium]HRT99147.1 PASTA domain-containing protein [Ignavibacteriales bacterium]
MATTRLKKIGITSLVLIAIFIVFNWLVMPLVTAGEEVKVPDLVGKTPEEAISLLNGLGFNYKIAGYKYYERYPKGVIVYQKPRGNMIVKEGRKIYLYLSSGVKLIVVPDFVGKSFREAELEISNLGLSLGKVDSLPSDEYSPNTVISQNISPGTQIQQKESINLTISTSTGKDKSDDIIEPNKVKVPNLVGKNLAQAKQILEENSLKVGKISYVPSISLMPNTVVDQYPLNGSVVFINTTIDLFVTKEAVMNKNLKQD